VPSIWGVERAGGKGELPVNRSGQKRVGSQKKVSQKRNEQYGGGREKKKRQAAGSKNRGKTGGRKERGEAGEVVALGHCWCERMEGILLLKTTTRGLTARGGGVGERNKRREQSVR